MCDAVRLPEHRPDVRVKALIDEGYRPENGLLVYQGITIPGVSDTRTAFCAECWTMFFGSESINRHTEGNCRRN